MFGAVPTKRPELPRLEAPTSSANFITCYKPIPHVG